MGENDLIGRNDRTQQSSQSGGAGSFDQAPLQENPTQPQPTTARLGEASGPYDAQGQAQNTAQGYYGYGAQVQSGQGPGAQGAPTGPRQPSSSSSGGTGRFGAARQRHGGLRTAIIGIIAGLVGAAVLVFALRASGMIGGTQVIRTTESAAGPTVNITASSEDATIAQAVAAKDLASVVSITVTTQKGQGLGSGVVLDRDGNIITNYHVIEGAQAISVSIDGTSYDATVVGSDSSSDIAVLHVDLKGKQVTPMEIGDSDSLVVGDWVMTIGSPFGLDQSVSAGIVSSLARNQLMKSTAGETIYANLIQVDAAINPGNSGGALVNKEGKLVGICTLFSSDTESFAGIGFAIPGNYAVNIAKKIIAKEPVTHAYIGLTMQTVNAQNAATNKLSVSQGAYVVSVTEGSPAAAAGIEKGDIITGFDSTAITSADGMILAVRSHNIGDTVTVKFMRGNEEKTASVTLGSDEELQKEQAQRNSGSDDSGIGNGGSGSQEDAYRKYLEEMYEQRRQQNQNQNQNLMTHNRGSGHGDVADDTPSASGAAA